jgi:hypothetical protein
MSAVESWRELPGGEAGFTMRRLASADQAFVRPEPVSKAGHQTVLSVMTVLL